MSAWLDVIGSMIIGSLLMTHLMGLNAVVTEQGYRAVLNFAAQADTRTVAEIMEYDMIKMGYGTSGADIALADTGQVEFMADLEANGSVDTLQYFTGDLLTGTPHPTDRILYRVKNGDLGQAIEMKVTSFRLSYFNANGDSLALPISTGDIRKIRVDYTTESPVAFDTTYEKTYMQLNVRPKNLSY